jgi:hypothetical protein
MIATTTTIAKISFMVLMIFSSFALFSSRALAGLTGRTLPPPPPARFAWAPSAADLAPPLPLAFLPPLLFAISHHLSQFSFLAQRAPRLPAPAVRLHLRPPRLSRLH